jgi:hypothetical protein
MLKSQQHIANPLGFDSHALPPFILIKSIGCVSENLTKPHQFDFGQVFQAGSFGRGS